MLYLLLPFLGHLEEQINLRHDTILYSNCTLGPQKTESTERCVTAVHVF